MKLKSKNLNLFAGRPIAILNEQTAQKLNVNIGERILLKYKSEKVYAVVDIFSKIIKEGYIGLSNETSSILKTKNGSFLEISTAGMLLGTKIINKKISGKRLTSNEIKILIKEISQNHLTESEIAYFVSAEKLQGMTLNETISLTDAMSNSGDKLKWDDKIIADKHCIGGIAGNRTTPLVVSICAAAGLKVPKNSSRAITSAAGTADVIETISNVEFSKEEIKKIVNKTGACLIWNGTLKLSPSDEKIIYVERILNLDVEPQLIASILSKKIAAGSTHILIDIPFNGGKIKKKEDARKLAKKFKKIAKYFKLKLKVVYTDGRQPIGNGIGPNLEMVDIINVLKNNKDAPKDLKEKSILLSANLMDLCGIKNSKKKARRILESGEAYNKFKEIINAQNKKELNSEDFEKRIKKLDTAKFSKTILAKKSGEITKISNRQINSLCRSLGTPETKSAGIYLHKKLGNVKKGDKILTMYSESKQKLSEALIYFNKEKAILIK